MKKKINKRKMQEKNGHKFLQLISFSFMFSFTRDLVPMIKEGRDNKGGHFFFLSYLWGKVQIYWFKLITSRKGREFRDLDWWSSSLVTFLFVEGRPLYLESHFLNNIILSLPNGV